MSRNTRLRLARLEGADTGRMPRILVAADLCEARRRWRHQRDALVIVTGVRRCKTGELLHERTVAEVP